MALAFVACIGVFFALGLDQWLTLEALRAHRAELARLVGAHAMLAPLAFALAYAAVVALSLPGGAAMTVAGGFLFGTVAGTGLVVVAATAGATALFVLARGVLGAPLRARAGPWLARMEAGFRANALSYMLVLRLVPLFPFFVVNLVPAFLGVRLRTYVVATVVGIVPGSFVFASVGAGLDSLFVGAGPVTLDRVLTPEIVLALCGLAGLALVPPAYRALRARKKTPSN